MTYSTYENSLDAGVPVELYEFAQGQKKWLFTNHEDSIVRQNWTYVPSSIHRSSVKQNTDVFKNALTLTFPRGDSFASQFITSVPDQSTTVTVFRGHLGDADGDYVTYWKGRITSAKTSGNQVSMECESVFTSIRRPGLRARYEYTCRHTLYLKGCNVARETYKMEGSVLSIANNVDVTVQGAATKPNGYFTGGMLIAPDGNQRFIIAHTSDLLTISRPLTSLANGQTVKIYPGCDHLKETCNNKFGNILNYGGFPWIPTDSCYRSNVA